VRANLRVVLDACVLIPMPLADTPLRLAAGPQLYLPKWTDQIMAEVSRNLQESFGLTTEQITYRESEIRRHFPEAWVEGYEKLVPLMKNSQKDRHVLAAAVRAKAEVIVTYNVKDFPEQAVAPHSIMVQGPSAFLTTLFHIDSHAVVQVLQEQASAIEKPLEYVLSRLRINAPQFVDLIRAATKS